jgi:hypothetical protein
METPVGHSAHSRRRGINCSQSSQRDVAEHGLNPIRIRQLGGLRDRHRKGTATVTTIEWTDRTCPCYERRHGTDKRWRDQDRSKESWHIARDVRGAGGRWRKMVHQLPRLAQSIRISIRHISLGWPYFELRAISKCQEQVGLPAQTKGHAGPLICTGARWRRPTSQTPDQLLCRSRPSAPSKMPSLHGLRSCVGTGRPKA